MSNYINCTIEELKDKVASLISAKRFAHCLRVSEEAVRIAKKIIAGNIKICSNGSDNKDSKDTNKLNLSNFDNNNLTNCCQWQVDDYTSNPEQLIEKCEIAGILHDCAREMTHEQYLALGVDISKAIENAPNSGMNELLLHGEAASAYASANFGVTDADILDAIACHTYGRPNMGLIAQIIFIADYTEPGRGEGEHFTRVRNALKREGLISACREECLGTIKYVLSRDGSGNKICTRTVETYNWAAGKQCD